MKSAVRYLFLLVLVVVVGCLPAVTQLRVGVREGEQNDISRAYSANFDQTWEAAIDVMQRYPITTIEKASGLLITDWVEGASDVYYSEIEGKKETLRDRSRFNVKVSAVGDGSRVTVNQYVKLRAPTYMISDPMMGTTGGPFYEWQDVAGIKDLPSRTPSQREKEILDAINASLNK